MSKDRIYLDYNATAPMLECVRDAMVEVMMMPHNPSSVHREGRAAKSLIERCRKDVAQHLSCFPHEIIFTSGGTEANNLALCSVGNMPFAVAVTEHSSVRAVRSDAYFIPVLPSGLLDMQALEAWLMRVPAPMLVAVMLANNETGVIQPIAEIAKLVHTYGGLLHCDAVQACGKIPVDMGLLGADMLSISGHKMGASQGIGALIVRHEYPMTPLIVGGGQELGRRGGTEAVPLIVGFATAINWMQRTTEWREKVRVWRDAWEQHIMMHSGSDASIILGYDAPRLPNTSCVRMKGRSSEVQLMTYDLASIAVSAGSACSSGRIAPSHVVAAMLGSDAGSENDIVRISMGWNSTEADMHIMRDAWCAAYDKTT
ncbi:MAG: cysteine desulfurase [Alphaproteobacteria bacterium]|nr:MAG: cysteine desulfurase [Alphaproteobacteria bacterium]